MIRFKLFASAIWGAWVSLGLYSLFPFTIHYPENDNDFIWRLAGIVVSFFGFVALVITTKKFVVSKKPTYMSIPLKDLKEGDIFYDSYQGGYEHKVLNLRQTDKIDYGVWVAKGYVAHTFLSGVYAEKENKTVFIKV